MEAPVRARKGRSDNRVAWAQTVCDSTPSRERDPSMSTRRPGALQPRAQTDRPASVTSRISRTMSQVGPGPSPKSGLWGDIEPLPGFGPTHPSTAMPGFPAVEFSDLRAPTFSREALRRGGVIMPTPARRPGSIAQPASPRKVPPPASPRKVQLVATPPLPSEELKRKPSAKLLFLSRKMSSRRSASQPAVPTLSTMPPPPLPTSPAVTRMGSPASPMSRPLRSPVQRAPGTSTMLPRPPHMQQPRPALHPHIERRVAGSTPPRVGPLPPGARPMLPPGAMPMLPPGAMPHYPPPQARSPSLASPIRANGSSTISGTPISGTPMVPPPPPPQVMRSWAPPGQPPLRHYRSSPTLRSGQMVPIPPVPPMPAVIPHAQSQYRPPHEFAPVPPQMWASRSEHAGSPAPDFSRRKPDVPQLPPLDLGSESKDFIDGLEGLEGALGMLNLPDLPSDGSLLPDLPSPQAAVADDATEPATSDKTISPPSSPKRWPPRASPVGRPASVCPPATLSPPCARMHPSSAPSTPLLPTTALDTAVETLKPETHDQPPIRPPRSPLRSRAELPETSPSLDSCESFSLPPRGMSLYASMDDDLRLLGSVTPTPKGYSTPPRSARMGRSSSSMSHESTLSLSSESTLSSLTSASSAASVDMPDPIAEDVSEDVHARVGVYDMDDRMDYGPRRGDVPRRQVLLEVKRAERAERAKSSIASVET